MIIFITQKQTQVNGNENLVIKDKLNEEDCNFLLNLPVIGIDLETNDLDPYKGDILLGILGNKDTQYVFDLTCESAKSNFYSIIFINQNKQIYLGANLKFDYKFIKVKFCVVLENMFDVMIAEQRLVQGTGYSSALAAIVERRLGKVMSKNVRSEFIGANLSTFIFSNRHIEYAANDIVDLFDIKAIQEDKIKSNKLEFLIYDIEFPLIKVLGDAELAGMNINEDKWKENIKNNKENKFLQECKLDEEVRRLRDNFMPIDDRHFFQNGKWDMIRRPTNIVVSTDLFGEEISIVDKKYKSPNINYGSPDIILYIFARFKQPVPTIDEKKNSGEYLVPKFIVKRDKKGIPKEVIDKGAIKPLTYTTGEKAIDSYIIENPKSPMKQFVKELIELRGFVNRINTFGEMFLTKYKNPVTGRFHTIYRQCDAITGRLQSGDKNNGWYNSQNIPRDKEYREAFYSDNDYIITTDLSGAEAVIMIDKARDEKFYEMAIVNDDAHSPLAQAIWRAVGSFRVDTAKSYNGIVKDEDIKLSNIVISKKENKDMRTAFKPHSFGDIYGMGIKKRSKTLGISEEESKHVSKIQRNMIPKTYAMVEANEQQALTKGYLVLNNRTNSRIWYLDVIEAKKNQSDLPSNVAHKIKNSARNGAIQGTQADMLKELMVEIHKEAVRQDLYNRFNFGLLKQVHDETVYRTNDITTLIEFIPDRPKKTVITTEGINVKQTVEIEMVTIPDFIKKWHSQVPNRYLSFIKMTCEQNVSKTWTK